MLGITSIITDVLYLGGWSVVTFEGLLMLITCTIK